MGWWWLLSNCSAAGAQAAACSDCGDRLCRVKLPTPASMLQGVRCGCCICCKDSRPQGLHRVGAVSHGLTAFGPPSGWDQSSCGIKNEILLANGEFPIIEWTLRLRGDFGAAQAAARGRCRHPGCTRRRRGAVAELPGLAALRVELRPLDAGAAPRARAPTIRG